jgi:hypothetical protein
MTETTTDPRFEDYEKMLWKMAHAHAVKTNRDVEELFAAASLGFVDAVRSWRKRKTNTIAFSTFLTQMVYFEYSNEGLRFYRRVRVEREQAADYAYHLGVLAGFEDPEESTTFKQSLESLSSDAQEVIKVVYNTPEELTKLTLGAIFGFFKNQGWNGARTNYAFDEIRTLLAE